MEKKEKGKFCSYCDYSGIIYNPSFEITGENALSPCPKCVMPQCKCGGEEPYYYSDGENILPCFCRDTRMKIDRALEIYSNCGIESRKFKWKTINDFKVVNNLAKEAKNAAYDIIRKFPDVNKGLYLWGNPGTGKTLLSSIILTELVLHHAVKGKFIKISRNFFNLLRSTFIEGSERYGQSGLIEKELATVDILVIDDFGVQRDSPWEQETLYNLIDARYEGEKFTIITSNNNPEKSLKELSEGRILSRIREMCRIMELSGEDFREKS
ncbi:MAG TPA: ATP-binding protein [Spirochaetota bacterium]|nr:ATP-binding protein [Spirochaetota bacterium]